MNDDELPRPFGPYLLLARLARGGMGEVFLAKHGGLQGFEKHCVVKTLRTELAAQDDYVKRFTEEARVVVQLSHRNVCPVFDVGRANGQLYVAMEHLIGRDLRMLSGRLTTAVAVHVVGEVLEALDYAHRYIDAETNQPLGIVHRDVSPHNVILGVEGDVTLIDFGIATTARSGPVNEGNVVLGKLGYMAPEHARGDDVDGRADEYAAAVLLTELLTGAGFFDGLSREQAWLIAGKGGHRPAAFASLDAALRAILDRALEPDREKRFATCAAFGDAVVDWARSRGHVADARDVRRLMAQAFPSLAAEIRELARTHANDHAPNHELVARTPGFETIATTMMVAPTTAGFGSSAVEAPATMLVRDRAKRDRTAPLEPSTPPKRIAPFAAAALVGALVAGAAVAVFVPRGDSTEVIALPPSVAQAGQAVGQASLPAADSLAPEDDDDDDVATTAGGDDPRDKPRVVKSSAAVAVRPNAKLSADAKRDVAYLSSSCIAKVTCAPELVAWSKKRINAAEAQQIAEAAKDCARKCRLAR
jgi:tRNA A-37 threonylcarbamoyl transferase component Bud32